MSAEVLSILFLPDPHTELHTPTIEDNNDSIKLEDEELHSRPSSVHDDLALEPLEDVPADILAQLNETHPVSSMTDGPNSKLDTAPTAEVAGTKRVAEDDLDEGAKRVKTAPEPTDSPSKRLLANPDMHTGDDIKIPSTPLSAPSSPVNIARADRVPTCLPFAEQMPGNNFERTNGSIGLVQPTCNEERLSRPSGFTAEADDVSVQSVATSYNGDTAQPPQDDKPDDSQAEKKEEKVLIEPTRPPFPSRPLRMDMLDQPPSGSTAGARSLSPASPSSSSSSWASKPSERRWKHQIVPPGVTIPFMAHGKYFGKSHTPPVLSINPTSARPFKPLSNHADSIPAKPAKQVSVRAETMLTTTAAKPSTTLTISLPPTAPRADQPVKLLRTQLFEKTELITQLTSKNTLLTQRLARANAIITAFKHDAANSQSIKQSKSPSPVSRPPTPASLPSDIAQIVSLKAERDILSKEKDDLVKQHESLTEENKKLREEARVAKEKMEVAHKAAGKTGLELGNARKEIKDLTNWSMELESENWRLEEEVRRLLSDTALE